VPDFLFGPQKDAGAQHVGLHRSFHEGHLVEAGGQEEASEFRQRLLAEITAAVEIVAAGLVACGEMAFIGGDVACQATRDRPDRTGIERVEQGRVRH
jgi:hypothetical protein